MAQQVTLEQIADLLEELLDRKLKPIHEWQERHDEQWSYFLACYLADHADQKLDKRRGGA